MCIISQGSLVSIQFGVLPDLFCLLHFQFLLEYGKVAFSNAFQFHHGSNLPVVLFFSSQGSELHFFCGQLGNDSADYFYYVKTNIDAIVTR